MNGNKKIWIVIVLAAVLLIGGYVAWQYDQKSVDSRQLRIGVILPLTGSSARSVYKAVWRSPEKNSALPTTRLDPKLILSCRSIM